MGATTFRRGIAAWSRAHPDLAEVAMGATATVALVAVSLWQWGVTEDGLTRGVSIGLILGILVAASWRRRRRADEERDRELLESRLQLARELHDAVAGQVAIVGIQAAGARRVLTTDPGEAALALERIETASRAAVKDLRRMLVTLRGDSPTTSGLPLPAPAPEPGLLDARRLLDEARASGLALTVTETGARPADLPPAVDRAAYRILGESLTNALKHGGSGADVEIRYEDHSVGLRVASDLRGGTVSAASGGLGIVGMRERARLLGGTLSAGPGPDGRWIVDARLPWR
jgi:signal transduction histidine kinase